MLPIIWSQGLSSGFMVCAKVGISADKEAICFVLTLLLSKLAKTERKPTYSNTINNYKIIYFL